MFGYIQANLNDLSEAEQTRYRSVYCGLCHMLKEQYGWMARFSLTYDLTFLILLLTSLYEPEEKINTGRCIAHPFRTHTFFTNTFTEYASDISVALVYHKCLDDWKDEHKAERRLYAHMLKPKYEAAKDKCPLQCAVIEEELKILSEIEKENTAPADAAAASFGRLMASLFVYKNDNWKPELSKIGFGLGRFIYMADAAIDYPKDLKKGNYNPLTGLPLDHNQLKPLLMQLLGEASESFERLPLVTDIHLLRNILYSGIWIHYNKEKRKGEDIQNG